MNFVRHDSKIFTFVTCKTRHLFLGGRKALNQRWCKQWRRAHKKESILRQVKKGHGKKTLKTERGIEGLNLQDLLRKKNETAEQRKKLASEKPSTTQKPQTKQAKKADLNARLRELRKKRKEAEEQKQSGGDKAGAKKAGAKKAAGGGKKAGAGAAASGGKKKGGGAKKGGGKKGGGKK